MTVTHMPVCHPCTFLFLPGVGYHQIADTLPVQGVFLVYLVYLVCMVRIYSKYLNVLVCSTSLLLLLGLKHGGYGYS